MKKIIFIYFLFLNVFLSFASNITGILNNKIFYDSFPLSHNGFIYLTNSNLNKFCSKDYALEDCLIALFQNRHKKKRIIRYKNINNFVQTYLAKIFGNSDSLAFLDVYFLFSSSRGYFFKFWNMTHAIVTKEEKKKKEPPLTVFRNEIAHFFDYGSKTNYKNTYFNYYLCSFCFSRDSNIERDYGLIKRIEYCFRNNYSLLEIKSEFDQENDFFINDIFVNPNLDNFLFENEVIKIYNKYVYYGPFVDDKKICFYKLLNKEFREEYKIGSVVKYKVNHYYVKNYFGAFSHLPLLKKLVYFNFNFLKRSFIKDNSSFYHTFLKSTFYVGKNYIEDDSIYDAIKDLNKNKFTKIIDTKKSINVYLKLDNEVDFDSNVYKILKEKILNKKKELKKKKIIRNNYVLRYINSFYD